MIKDKINNTIEQLNKQFTDFQNKIKSVKALTIYSQEEINRRTEAIYKQYEETVSSAIDNLEKSVKSCIDIEVNKLTTEAKNNENAQRILSDFHIISSGEYDDETLFLFIKQYMGDLLSMKKLCGIPKIDDAKYSTTRFLLCLAYRIDTLSADLCNAFSQYLKLNKCRYSYITKSTANLSFAVNEQTLINIVYKFESTIEIIEQAKKATYSDINNLIEKMKNPLPDEATAE